MGRHETITYPWIFNYLSLIKEILMFNGLFDGHVVIAYEADCLFLNINFKVFFLKKKKKKKVIRVNFET